MQFCRFIVDSIAILVHITLDSRSDIFHWFSKRFHCTCGKDSQKSIYFILNATAFTLGAL